MPMTFTKLNFDAYASSKVKEFKAQLAKLDGDERAKVSKAAAAQYVKEMNRQLGIFAKEEMAYVKFVLSMHAESKQLVQGIVTDVKGLQKKFDKKVALRIGAKVAKLKRNWDHISGSRKNLVAHQGMRTDPLKTRHAVEVFGAVEGPKICNAFMAVRKRLIDALVGVRDKVTKVEEFVKRGEDLRKVAESLNKRQIVNISNGLQDIVAAQKILIKLLNDIDSDNSKVHSNLKNFKVSLKKNSYDKRTFKGEIDRNLSYQKSFKAHKAKVKTCDMKHDALVKRFGDLNQVPAFKRAFANLPKLTSKLHITMEAYMIAVDSYGDLVKDNRKQFDL